ncbi:Lhr family helicase, partial [Streptomyces viridochromogenes]|uniref:Lhr family helicase n=2 Tax=Streptomyces TaxID=1883 RepID=UPI003F9ABF5A
ARTLLDRHGVVTRGAVAAEGVEGGFSATYRILAAFEESGQARRGYVVEGLGAAQFAMDGAVDRLRAVSNARDRGEDLPVPRAPGTDGSGGTPDDPDGGPSYDIPDLDHDFLDAHLDRLKPDEYVSPLDRAAAGTRRGPTAPWANGARRNRPAPDTRAVVLAAADPANAYGAALPWPEPPTGAGHKPGRKAGSLVVLVDGELTLYMERGGKTLLAWPSAPETEPADDVRLRAAAEALAGAAAAGSLGTVTVERVNGAAALTSSVGTLLEAAGFIATPRGLRLRA